MTTEVVTTQGPTLTEEDERGIELYLDNLYLGQSAQKLKPVHKLQFTSICRAYGLNPLKRQIYAFPTKYGTREESFAVIIAYENFLQRAEKTGLLTHWSTEFSAAKTLDGKPDIACTITIERRDWARPFVHTVYLSEYTKDNHFWRKSPRTMLKKVTVAQGFRLCFSLECGDMPYIAEELDYRPQSVAVPTITRNPPTQVATEAEATPMLPAPTPNTPESSEGSEGPQNASEAEKPEAPPVAQTARELAEQAPTGAEATEKLSTVVNESACTAEEAAERLTPAEGSEQPDLFAANPDEEQESARKGYLSGLHSLFKEEQPAEVLAFFKSKRYLPESASSLDEMDAEHAQKAAKNAGQCLNIFRAWAVGYRRKTNGGKQ